MHKYICVNPIKDIPLMSSACRILDFLPLHDNSMLGYNKQKLITFILLSFTGIPCGKNKIMT